MNISKNGVNSIEIEFSQVLYMRIYWVSDNLSLFKESVEFSVAITENRSNSFPI